EPIEAEPAGLAAEQVERGRRDSVEAQGGEADPAVPGDQRGHALAHLRGQIRHRKERAVVVRMRVDETGGNDAVRGVDLADPPPVPDHADRDDTVGGDANIGPAPRSAGPVDHEAVANDEVDLGHARLDYLTMRTLQSASWLTFFDT